EVTAAEYESALEERHRFEEAAHESMAGVDALLLPATAIVAPRGDAGPEVREPLSRFTRPVNTTHQPVAVLPALVDGLPVGIQVAGKTNGDTLRAAAWLEKEWRRRAA
ncbi:MAG TPA: amidase family protein, partial [Candidatus Dormibacteraeota bacterium]|nr:amidase family protein [Candidatus Dormibacteraeota bacterium]